MEQDEAVALMNRARIRKMTGGYSFELPAGEQNKIDGLRQFLNGLGAGLTGRFGRVSEGTAARLSEIGVDFSRAIDISRKWD